MPKIHKSVDSLIGGTPILELCAISKECGLKARVFAKLEYLNPAGSIKDRVAKNMIDCAEREGILTEDSVIIEPTSGNTGIGLAAVAASRGYRVIIVMPDTMSVERRILMTAYGAELVLTDGKLGMSGSIAKAEELSKEIPNSFVPGQFSNPANAQAHYITTGPEIFEDMDGEVDVLVAGVGTGGTITGVGRYLKEQKPEVEIVGVEPSSSAVLSGEEPGPHGLQGIGAGFVPKVLDVSVIDRIITVSEEQAYTAGRLLGNVEGVLVGISSGAALHAALELARCDAYAGKNIMVILPDTGDRYLSTQMFSE